MKIRYIVSSILLMVLAVACEKQKLQEEGGNTVPGTDDSTEVVLERIVLSDTSLVLNEGDIRVLSAKTFPEGGSFTLSWSSSDSNVAVVDGYGMVTALSVGDATVTVSCGDIHASCAVTVMGNIPDFPVETVLVPAGTFIMGTPVSEPARGDDELQHEVTISKDFYIGKYEVTNAEYAEFLNDTGVPGTGQFDTGDYGTQQLVLPDEWGVLYEDGRWIPAEDLENSPVVMVTWYGANEYAEWAGGFLPTEAQWEYACRGGQKESLPFGIGDGTVLNATLANFRSNFPYDMERGGQYEDASAYYPARPMEVGSYEPNGYGIYDMHGNVYEWCSDWKDAYPDMPVTDPSGPDSPTSDYTKVLRGGSWFIHGQYCRSGDRDHLFPTGMDIYIGFRVAFHDE